MTTIKKGTTKRTTKPSGKKIYTCRTCGRTTTEKKHLCNPGLLTTDYICEYCGATSSNPLHLCKPKVEDAQYYCDSCGRVAVSKNLLCKPKILK